MPGAIDQNHAMIFGEPAAERLAHDFQIRTGAMDHHKRRTFGVARTGIEDVEHRAIDRDHLSLRGIMALHDKDAGLRDQREQSKQHNHDD